MSLFTPRIRVQIEGIMPERALLRLKRAGIPLYNVKKTQKNRLLLLVNQKDVEKVFAFYPNVCYNNSEKAPYKATNLGLVGLAKYIEQAKNRTGLLLGGLLFLVLVLFFNSFTFGVKIVGSDIYAREGKIALEKVGNIPFAPYKKGKEDIVCATLLRLDGMEYCSVKKEGLYIRLEMRVSPFESVQIEKESMYAKHAGVIRSLAVLKGTSCKKAGDTVSVGDMLVENAFYLEDKGQVRVEVIARAVIDCVFEEQIEAESESQAFAEGYLRLGLSPLDEIATREVLEISDGLYQVKIGYTVIETINL